MTAYEPRLRDQFRHHPKCDEIIQDFKDGKYSITEIDKVFAEAEAYNWQHFNEISKKPRPIITDASGNEFVRFEIHEGTSD
ncbi:hypothetical protein ACFY7C_36795 [Streptomyces sp. NPDC012769]|uniref:hypothetical protein n=1 Tax=Streptomyces sp. NPDC012769 TaxID=3364848 RepID=UPI00367B039C